MRGGEEEVHIGSCVESPLQQRPGSGGVGGDEGGVDEELLIGCLEVRGIRGGVIAGGIVLFLCFDLWNGHLHHCVGRLVQFSKTQGGQGGRGGRGDAETILFLFFLFSFFLLLILIPLLDFLLSQYPCLVQLPGSRHRGGVKTPLPLCPGLVTREPPV